VRVLTKFLVLLIVVLGACYDPPPEKGYVIDKNFNPAHWESGFETYYVPEYTCRSTSRYNPSTGNYETGQDCGVQQVAKQRWEDHHTWHSDSWKLKLKDCQMKDGKEKCRTGWKRVDETTYHQYAVGQHYPNPR
jgi:hypothetical protein